MAPEAGTGVDTSVNTMLDQVISPVGYCLTVRLVPEPDVRPDAFLGWVARHAEGFSMTAAAKILTLKGIISVPEKERCRMAERFKRLQGARKPVVMALEAVGLLSGQFFRVPDRRCFPYG